MKTMILAALTILSLGAAVVPAFAAASPNGSTIAGDSVATRMQQTGQYSQ
jgi:hypothetical protein